MRKSLGAERTFAQNLETLEACQAALHNVLAEVKNDLAKRVGEDAAFTKVFVKLKFANFQTTTKEAPSTTLEPDLLLALLEEAWGRSPHSVRLLGVGVRFPAPPEADERQLGLFDVD